MPVQMQNNLGSEDVEIEFEVNTNEGAALIITIRDYESADEQGEGVITTAEDADRFLAEATEAVEKFKASLGTAR